MKTTLQTKRLTLRPYAPSDAARLAYLAGDYAVARMCGRVPHPYTLAMAHDWIGRHDGDRDSGVDFPFAITLPRDGVIGACGVNRLPGGPDGCWEIGYWLGRPYWGLGYASEAAQALMDWAREDLAATAFAAGHFADNPASGNVLRKLGFTPTGPAELYGLARQRADRAERYVWPEGAAAANLSALQAHPPH